MTLMQLFDPLNVAAAVTWKPPEQSGSEVFEETSLGVAPVDHTETGAARTDTRIGARR
jgi:hypothetical protein